MKIVVDAMGSDNFPAPDVEGAVRAAREWGDDIILVGDKAIIQNELGKHDTAGLPIHIEHASEIIGMTDKPSDIVRGKPNSSMHVGMNLVKSGDADAFFSAGNTGGVLAVAMLGTLRRIKGVKRPAIGAFFPIPTRPMLLDNGANADCSPEILHQFAVMGSLYFSAVVGKKNPRVALISNGEEDGKGNQLVKDTIPLLKDSPLNYVGNMEPKHFFLSDQADVIVADGFTGNVMLKTAEATAKLLVQSIREEVSKSLITKIGAGLARPALRRVAAQLDPNEIGGAPLLGVNGVVLIGHGSSNAHAVHQAVGQARVAVQHNIVETIREGIR